MISSSLVQLLLAVVCRGRTRQPCVWSLWKLETNVMFRYCGLAGNLRVGLLADQSSCLIVCARSEDAGWNKTAHASTLVVNFEPAQQPLAHL